MNMTAPRNATAARTIVAPKIHAIASSGPATATPRRPPASAEAVDPVVGVERGLTAEEMAETGQCDEHDDGTGDRAEVVAFALLVAAAADQQHAATDQRRWHEHPQQPDEETRTRRR